MVAFWQTKYSRVGIMRERFEQLLPMCQYICSSGLQEYQRFEDNQPRRYSFPGIKYNEPVTNRVHCRLWQLSPSQYDRKGAIFVNPGGPGI